MMEHLEQNKLFFHGVDIVNVELTSMKKYSKDDKVDILIESSVLIPEGSNLSFKIIFDVKVMCKDCFDIKLVGVGNFRFSREATESEQKSFINVNAAAIVFPYIRSFLTTLTSNLGNFGYPIILPTRIFKGELQKHDLVKTPIPGLI